MPTRGERRREPRAQVYWPAARARGGASRPAAGVSPCRRAAGAPRPARDERRW